MAIILGASSLGREAATESTSLSSTLSCSLVWLPYMEFAMMEGLLTGDRENEKDKAKVRKVEGMMGEAKRRLSRVMTHAR